MRSPNKKECNRDAKDWVADAGYETAPFLGATVRIPTVSWRGSQFSNGICEVIGEFSICTASFELSKE